MSNNFLTKEKLEVTNYQLSLRGISKQDELNALYEAYDTLAHATLADTLEIRINSFGGYVHTTMELLTLIKGRFYGRVTGIVTGNAMSAGSFTLAACDTRIVYPHSNIMIHDFSGGYMGNRQDIADSFEHDVRFSNEVLYPLVKPYLSKKERKEYKKGRDLYFTGVEALSRGLATHIVVKGEILTADDYFKETE